MPDAPAGPPETHALSGLRLDVVLRRAGASALFGLALLGAGMAVAGRLASGPSWQELAARARPGPLLLASLLMSGAFFFMGNRWRSLMPPDSPAHPGGLTAMLCTGLLLNYAFPGPVGELGAAWFAHRRYRMGFADCLASGVAGRVVGLISASLLSALLWVVWPLPVPDQWRPLVGGSAAILGVGGVALGFMAARPRVWQALSARLLGWIHRPERLARLARRVNQGVAALTESLADVVGRGAPAYLRATGWALGGHAAVMSGIVIAAQSFGASPDPVGVAFTYAMTTAGAAVLFAFPGSQLGWDAMFVALLVATSGLSLADAVAVAAVVRLQQVGMLGVGALALAWLMATGPSDDGSESSKISGVSKQV